MKTSKALSKLFGAVTSPAEKSANRQLALISACLLYTSDAADDV